MDEAQRTQPSAEYEAWRNARQHELVDRVRLSALYHSKRERRLLGCARAAQAFTALAATTAFSRIVSPDTPAFAAATLAAAIASILPLVFGWNARASTHAVLAADHRRLLARIAGAGFELGEDLIAKFSEDFANVEAEEGASLGALVVQCQNEMAVASGHPESVVPLRWYQRLSMHFWDWNILPPQRSPAQ